MINRIFILSFLFSGLSYASISDLQYLPEEGKFHSQTEFGYVKTEMDLKYNGKSYYKSETDNTAIAQDFSYGFAKNISGEIGIIYDLKDEMEVKWGAATVYNGNVDKYKSKGLRDIELTLKSRLYDESDKRFDVSAILSPKTGDAESASKTKEGNSYRGGSILKVEGEFGTKSSEYQFSGYFFFQNNFDREQMDLSDNKITEYDSSKDFGFGVRGKYFVNERFHLYGAFGLIMYGEVDYREQGSGTVTNVDQGTGKNIELELEYELVKDKTMLAFGAQFLSADYDLTEGSTFIDGESDQTLWGLRLTHEF